MGDGREKHKKEGVETEVSNGSRGERETARNEAEKAHINNEMAQCSRRQGKKAERERDTEERNEMGVCLIRMQALAT